MKGFYFDLVARPVGQLWMRIVVIFAGLACLLAVASYYQLVLKPQLDAQRLQLQAEMKKISGSTASPSSMSARDLDQAWQHAREASAQLNLPWPHLFMQLAKASQAGNVALLSIEPDTQKGHVVLVAEARSMDSMLLFLKDLQSSPDFDGVTLQSHSINKAVPENPVRFRVTAVWRTDK